jgi:adenine-specific DNA-methyltransferase
MPRSPRSPNGKPSKQVDALKHDEATRRNIPTAEMESFFRREEDAAPRPPKHFPRARPLAEGETRTSEEPSQPELIWNGARITITDEQMKELAETGALTLSEAQLVWRGKDRQDWSDLVVNVPPLYIQEKIHPKAIIDDLKRRTTAKREAESDAPDLFADFNGIEPDQRAEFYQHDQHWSNRMILGDSLQVMASLSERESLKGKVQCIYFDPPYGIKFNSNWQVSTQSRDVKDGKQADISREPEQVKAFRDTWKDGIHSYLTYLRDRLTAMRDLLSESGSIFVQIGDENVHRVRTVMDEVFGSDNIISEICLRKTGGQETNFIPNVADFIIWYGKNRDVTKYRQLHFKKEVGLGEGSGARYDRLRFADGQSRAMNRDERAGGSVLSEDARAFQLTSLISSGVRTNTTASWKFQGRNHHSGVSSNWKTSLAGLAVLAKADRIEARKTTPAYVRFVDDFAAYPVSNVWTDVAGAAGIVYVVQTSASIIERCILMATDPSDLVLDPTCGSGTTAYVAEQWGRRWKAPARRHADPQRHPPRLRLRARAAHHPQVDRQQPADRRHLAEVAGCP